MKIVKNEKLIKRNSKIGQWTNLAALVVLLIGMYISFKRQELFVWVPPLLLVSFTLTQISMYFGNRWGRSPRPDEQLDAGLKGLPSDYVIYHWMTPASHLLVGPAGLWVLLPYSLRGKVTYQKNRWRVTGGGFVQAYLRIFGQEGLGRPDLEAEAEINAVRKALSAHMEESEIPPIQAALVFTDDQLIFEAEDAPLPVLPLKKLKDFMRNKAKEKPITTASLQAVKAILPS